MWIEGWVGIGVGEKGGDKDESDDLPLCPLY